MRIQCPLNPDIVRFLLPLLNLGVEEFYCGYYNKTDDLSSNVFSRRPGKKYNFEINKLVSVVDCIKKHEKKIFITLNQNFYSPKHIVKVLRDISYLVKIGIDGLIVSDIALIKEIRNKFPDLYLIASTITHISNSSCIKFYNNLGISRIILPRDLSISEIKGILKNNPYIDYEIFIKNDKCPNIDGLCAYEHGTYDKEYDLGCQLLQINNDSNDFCFKKKPFLTFACGACSLFDFKDNCDLSLKIVGRDKDGRMIFKDAIFISECLRLLNWERDKKIFMQKCKELHKKIIGKGCHMHCYYRLYD